MIGVQKGNQVQLCASYPPEMTEQLEKLMERTRIPLATYMREALEDLLRKYDVPSKETGKSKRGSE